MLLHAVNIIGKFLKNVYPKVLTLLLDTGSRLTRGYNWKFSGTDINTPPGRNIRSHSIQEISVDLLIGNSPAPFPVATESSNWRRQLHSLDSDSTSCFLDYGGSGRVHCTWFAQRTWYLHSLFKLRADTSDSHSEMMHPASALFSSLKMEQNWYNTA